MEKARNDKSFFYVFPTLKVEDDIQILFTDVEVQKITTNSRRDFLHVYIYALLREYRDSIILELKERSILASNMFAQAKIHYEDGNVVCLELLDSIVSEGRKEEILAFLENLFTRRFHMKADIRITYREADGEGTREYDEQRVQQEINAIFERRARQNGVPGLMISAAEKMKRWKSSRRRAGPQKDHPQAPDRRRKRAEQIRIM